MKTAIIAAIAAMSFSPVALAADPDFRWITDKMIEDMQACTFNNAVSGMYELDASRQQGVNVIGPLAKLCAYETGFLQECSSHYRDDSCAIVAVNFAQVAIEKADKFYGRQVVGGK